MWGGFIGDAIAIVSAITGDIDADLGLLIWIWAYSLINTYEPTFAQDFHKTI